MCTFMLTKADFMGYCSCTLKFFFTIKTLKLTIIYNKKLRGALPHSEPNR